MGLTSTAMGDLAGISGAVSFCFHFPFRCWGLSLQNATCQLLPVIVAMRCLAIVVACASVGVLLDGLSVLYLAVVTEPIVSDHRTQD